MKEIKNKDILKILKKALNLYKNNIIYKGLCSAINHATQIECSMWLTASEECELRSYIIHSEEMQNFVRSTLRCTVTSYEFHKQNKSLYQFFWWPSIRKDGRRNAADRIYVLKNLIEHYKALPEDEIAVII